MCGSGCSGVRPGLPWVPSGCPSVGKQGPIQPASGLSCLVCLEWRKLTEPGLLTCRLCMGAGGFWEAWSPEQPLNQKSSYVLGCRAFISLTLTWPDFLTCPTPVHPFLERQFPCPLVSFSGIKSRGSNCGQPPHRTGFGGPSRAWGRNDLMPRWSFTGPCSPRV